ncbi:MAG: DUF547 domain-containing protein [Chitinophagales bacterium]
MNKVIIFLVSSIMLLVSCSDSSKTSHSQNEQPQQVYKNTTIKNTEQATTNSSFPTDTLVDNQDTKIDNEIAPETETSNSALADKTVDKSVEETKQPKVDKVQETVVENVQKPKTTSPPSVNSENKRLSKPNITNAIVADNAKEKPSTIVSASDKIKNIKKTTFRDIQDRSSSLGTASKNSFATRTEKRQAPKASPTPPKSFEKADELTSFFAATDAFLKKYVANGRVAYSKINKGELDALVEQVANMNLAKANSNAKQAFYINAYNISVIKSILDNNLPASPLDVSGFFKSIQHKVAGSSMTLDHLEKQLLFGLKKDARFHFAVVCAAVSCPRIESFAYMPEKLDAQLDRQTKRAVNDASFTKVNSKKKLVELSKIFEWYKADFEQNGKSLLDFVNQYRSEKIPAKYKIGFYEYDWKLNKQ